MSAEILQLSVKHLSRLPRLSDLVSSSLPSPRPTVPASKVPALFQEPYILSGYRPIQQDWRCYFLSLFQRHNESLNVWTHLLAVPVLLLRWWANAGALGFALDAASLPLSLFMVSALTYLSLSVAAHLLQSRSERAHYFFFFMDYVGVAAYQYGCSLGHYFYTSEAAWRAGVGLFFLPGAAFFGWLSCAGCCFAKSRYERPYPLQRKICQLIPTSLAYLLDISPVAHRLLTTSWTQEAFHALQIVSFLFAAFFFSCPVPECFFPGRCDFVGQGHQVFHLFLSLCTLFQLEALFQDYARRRDTVLEVFGERQLWWACMSFPGLLICCVLTALIAVRHTNKKLLQEQEKNK
ncbi:membrane progestin receptor beta [Austrofundulus limnaeus]|uniref:Membrane progestin receptor beta-like n=1 Tax=Austrofundulus limnaeus TaxID=52670 RepID=A0A2I4CRY4_AUSLI|nr:PREDICTED: membrane progestin receptor beta-like [Austrofundulus limnaeus]XP_013882751.1 PREDICTED: membrane progestin receptor beta-like [Austrofundulus limnaeus]XP_013882752.1 PREDICTED: membrane progestin receptor beta-like [Austrofundulus limnaeus]